MTAVEHRTSHTVLRAPIGTDVSGTRRVLIVEGDGGLRNLVSFMVKASGYDVVTAADAPEALRQYVEAGADLMIVDRDLPGESGLSMCSRMSEGWTSRTPPVIMLFDRLRRRDIERARSVGVVQCLEKPLRLPDLIDSIRWFMPESSTRSHGSAGSGTSRLVGGLT